jgi:hypothetical protein
MLSYHPYYVVNYSYSKKFKDPTKQTHSVRDRGKVFIDALDGLVLNHSPGSTKGLTRTLKLIVSRDAREEDKRQKNLIAELSNFTSVKEYTVEGGESYKVRILEPVINPRSAKKSAIDFIIEKNTHTVSYRTTENLLKTVVHVPKQRNINIKSIALVMVPRWDIYFKTVNRTYSKEVFGCSGTVLENTIKYCQKHTGLLKKENIAVCEICGQALCEKHVSECPICGKWLCDEDGTSCNNCGRVFCNDHITSICEVCNKPLCQDCKVTCSICKKEFCQTHTDICSECGKQICPDCSTTVGRLRRRKVCKFCNS